MSGLVPENALVAGAGRGSFLIFLESIANPMAVLNLTRDITNTLAKGTEVDGINLTCACHSGIALTSTDGKTADVLLRTDQPDAVHQIRVSARRLRSAVGSPHRPRRSGGA